jgi:hypothetical protein
MPFPVSAGIIGLPDKLCGMSLFPFSIFIIFLAALLFTSWMQCAIYIFSLPPFTFVCLSGARAEARPVVGLRDLARERA